MGIRALYTLADHWEVNPYIVLTSQMRPGSIILELPSRYCKNGVIQEQPLQEDGYTCLALVAKTEIDLAPSHIEEIRENTSLMPGQFRLTHSSPAKFD